MLPFQLHKSIRISSKRVSKEYPASLFTAKQKGITHSTLVPMTFGWRGGGKKVRLPPTHTCQYVTDAERRYIMQLRTGSC